MCGRYVRKCDKQRIAEAFGSVPVLTHLPELHEDCNIAPTTFQPVVRESREGARELVLMRWGLIPFFTRQLADIKGVSTINARAEMVNTSKNWREPFHKRRRLIPADAFYEWQKLHPPSGRPVRQPFVFTVPAQEPFAFAGLWDAWKDAHGGWLQSFAIVTTEANELMSAVHTRMPVILRPAEYARWLSRERTDQPPIDLLRPFASDAMQMRPANPPGRECAEQWAGNAE